MVILVETNDTKLPLNKEVVQDERESSVITPLGVESKNDEVTLEESILIDVVKRVRSRS